LARQFLPNPRFESDKTQVADASFDWPETFALVEYKATRFTRHQKYSGDADALLKGIDDAFAKDKKGAVKGVAQLGRSANKILTGSGITGATSIGERSILPILVIAEPGLTIEFVRRRLDRKLQSLIDREHRDRVLPLVLLSQFDIEAFETYVGESSAESIMRSYVHSLHNEPISLLDGFGMYVQRNYGNSIDGRPIYMQLQRSEQLAAVAERFGVSKEPDHDAAETLS
jgi:hypothetical protein